MPPGKGDLPAQRKRRKKRYRGCRVCGIPNAKWCSECQVITGVLRLHWPPGLSLIVDGSFVTASGDRERPRLRSARYAPFRARITQDHPDWDDARVEAALIEALVGMGVPIADGPGHGGAGLVLASAAGEILASRTCAFPADSSSDAELHAVIRGARWAPGVPIYTDSESTCPAAILSNAQLDVRFLRPSERTGAYELAHRLSVEGRLSRVARFGVRSDATSDLVAGGITPEGCLGEGR